MNYMENLKEREENLEENKNQNNTEENLQTETPPTTTDEIQQLKNTIEELQKQNELFKDQLLRKAAEFENYKKRTENDLFNITKYANEELIEKLLPILDDLERFLDHSKQENSTNDPFYKGVELIYNKFIRILELQGLQKIDCVGHQFDVNLHDALLVIPNEDPNVAANTIIQEVEKGYKLHDKIIRHAKVIVAGEPNTVQNNNQESGAD